jgi:uncharacterized membrane protein
MFGIRGFVIDSASHNPVKAKIELVGHDFDSSFVFSDSLTGKYYRLINSGNYSIRFSAPGYFTKEIQNVSVNNRQTTWLDVALTSTNKSGLTIAGKKEFIIFPNPCKRSFQISNSESLPNKFNIEISDLSGKIVGRLSNISTNESVNAEYLPAGIYFLYIRTKSNFVRKKLIIER